MPTWAYIFEHPGTDPAVDRLVIERGGQTTIVAAVPAPTVAPAVAAELAASGARLIELCGGFTTADVARVRDAVPPTVAVGHVTFAVDSVAAATAYSAAFEAESGRSA